MTPCMARLFTRDACRRFRYSTRATLTGSLAGKVSHKPSSSNSFCRCTRAARERDSLLLSFLHAFGDCCRSSLIDMTDTLNARPLSVRAFRRTQPRLASCQLAADWANHERRSLLRLHPIPQPEWTKSKLCPRTPDYQSSASRRQSDVQVQKPLRDKLVS